VLTSLREWASGGGAAVCWLHGPAGAGKSTIAHTLAAEYDELKLLAFSYFFSRRYTARSDLAAFVPTLAFELSRAIPDVEHAIDEQIKSNPRLFQQRLRDQLDSIAKIAIPFVSSSPARVVIIDGLDEYVYEEGKILLQDIIRSLIAVLVNKLQLRILFTSRPEIHIAEIFCSFSATRVVRLQDYTNMDEIIDYLKEEFKDIATRRKLEDGWPGIPTIKSLAQKSEGIYAYTSTLLRFVDDRRRNPKRQLEIVERAHKGLDPLYIEVLNNALKDAQDPENPDSNFKLVLGASMVLRELLRIADFASLLGIDVEDVRTSLRGCHSVIDVPDGNDRVIRPHHTSLQDFLTDPQRHGDRFFKTNSIHQDIFRRCIENINGPSGSFRAAQIYAHRHWAYHLHQGLADPKTTDPNTMGMFRTTVVTLLVSFHQDCRNWVYKIFGDSYVQTLMEDLGRLQVNIP
jgi:hypothetical protein